jgi:Ca2+:H+ antiporter
VFTPLEIIALAGGAIVIGIVGSDGESTWVEGAALLAVYLMVASAAFLWPIAGMT